MYRRQDLEHTEQRLIDSSFQELEGTNCYCSEESAAIIRQAISGLPLNAVHYIGTGDYHYISLFWAELITEPFILILFDNHPDDQPAAFGGDMLSCGSWVKEVRSLPFCKGTFWIQKESDGAVLDRLPELPVYLSIDLDVLSTDFARTDWNQGDMSLPALEGMVLRIKKDRRIIGSDICGGLTIGKGASAEDQAINAGTTEALRILLSE